MPCWTEEKYIYITIVLYVHLTLREHAGPEEAEQTDSEAGLLPSHLPPDEAFPPFLWSNIMQSFIMRESPQGAI